MIQFKEKMTQQAIVTRYLGATNTRGARIKATCAGGSVTVNRYSAYANGLTPSVWDDEVYAIQKLCDKLGWTGMTWTRGGMPNGDNVWVSI